MYFPYLLICNSPGSFPYPAIFGSNKTSRSKTPIARAVPEQFRNLEKWEDTKELLIVADDVGLVDLNTTLDDLHKLYTVYTNL